MTTTVPMPSFVTASPNLVTKRDIRSAPVAADSEEVVRHLAGQVAEKYAGIAALNVTQFGAASYAVDEATPWVPVGFRDEQRKGYTPAEFRTINVSTSTGILTGYLASAPIPPEAKPAVGTDAHLGVAHPLNGTQALTEYWKARRDAQGAWSAVWGGRIDDLATTTGQYPGTTGVSASGLMMPAHVIGIREAQAGRIEHAVGLGITRVAAGLFSWPAVRSDGRSTDADAVHIGRIFRLPDDVDLDAIRWQPWPGARPIKITALCRMVAEAAKTFGLIVVDGSGGVSIGVESGAPVRAVTGTDPWTKLLGSQPPYRALGGFPWEQLEVLPFDDNKPVA